MTKQQRHQRQLIFEAIMTRRQNVEARIAELNTELDDLDEAFAKVRDVLR